MAVLRDAPVISRQDTIVLLRYALGIAIEITVAFWLLSVARDQFAWAAWIAYLILAVATLATLIGLSWFWLRFAGRWLGWGLVTVLCLFGTWLLASGTKLSWHAIFDLWHRIH